MGNRQAMSSPAMLARKVCKALAIAGTHTPADVEKAIEEGRFQHWEDGETIVVTMICQEPLMKICKVFLVAGDLDAAWKIHDEQILPWAKSLGCSRISGEGRKGWEKSARKRGYTKVWVGAAMEI